MASRSVSAAKKLFVGNLPWTVSKYELKEYFSKFGQVTLTQVLFNKESGISRGFGFVRFSNQEAYNAVLSQEKHHLEGSVLTVQMSNVDRNFS